jgi:hypothetical protein
VGNQHIVKLIGGQAYISRNQAIEDGRKMAKCILDLEQRMHEIHVAATKGQPDPKAYPWWQRIMPGFVTRVRLAHVAGLTRRRTRGGSASCLGSSRAFGSRTWPA